MLQKQALPRWQRVLIQRAAPALGEGKGSTYDERHLLVHLLDGTNGGGPLCELEKGAAAGEALLVPNHVHLGAPEWGKARTVGVSDTRECFSSCFSSLMPNTNQGRTER